MTDFNKITKKCFFCRKSLQINASMLKSYLLSYCNDCNVYFTYSDNYLLKKIEYYCYSYIAVFDIYSEFADLYHKNDKCLKCPLASLKLTSLMSSTTYLTLNDFKTQAEKAAKILILK